MTEIDFSGLRLIKFDNISNIQVVVVIHGPCNMAVKGRKSKFVVRTRSKRD